MRYYHDYSKSIQFRQFHKKYNKKSALILHKKTKIHIFYNKNQFKTFTPIRLLIFSKKTPSSHISTILLLCQAFYQLPILSNFSLTLNKSNLSYSCCITLKRVTSWRGPSPRHWAYGRHSCFFRTNVATVASRWQH